MKLNVFMLINCFQKVIFNTPLDMTHLTQLCHWTSRTQKVIFAMAWPYFIVAKSVLMFLN